MTTPHTTSPTLGTSAAGASDSRLAPEQTHLDAVYARLDAQRATAERRRAEALIDTSDTPQARSERESYNRRYTEELAKYDASEHNLYFGRIDLDDGDVRRIGRIGVLADDAEATTLLLDWRAPLARPFYVATPASREGVELRRHLRTRSRRVRAVTDELLVAGDGAPAAHGDVVNESALVEALTAARTGRMTDIVETIQREQDAIIRSTHRGVTVVQGGPGTGKTAVALHRAAYLLYTHREVLGRSGVLIIGPNDTFLRYIGQVLPSLGETGVLLSTIGNLYPGVRATRSESAETRAIKGSLWMLEVLKDAVRDRQELPDEPVPVHFDGYRLDVDARLVRRARGRARSSRRPHNLARDVFLRAAIEGLADAHAAQIGTSVTDGSSLLTARDLADIRDDMAADDDIVAVFDRFWPQLTPQRVLAELFTSPARLQAATYGWDEDERALLARTGGGFAASDAPLLDELAELLGIDSDEAEEAEQLRWRQRLADAQDALDILTGSAPQDIEDELDPEILMAYDLIDAEQLAARQEQRESLTTAQRAVADRTWTYGHVIIDEAQELSPMDWRMVMRRIPNRWMTVIGDTAQTGSLAGADDWSEVLEPYVAKRWRLESLTVNYRTPAEIMDVAADVLAVIDPDAETPRSIRSGGIVRRLDGPVADVPSTLSAVAAVLEEPVDGITAVVVTDARAGDPALAAAVADAADASLYAVGETKGLEFDRVVVVDPEAITRQSPRGSNDLYVALTRATKELVLIS